MENNGEGRECVILPGGLRFMVLIAFVFMVNKCIK